jgi:hypothetical protein
MESLGKGLLDNVAMLEDKLFSMCQAVEHSASVTYPEELMNLVQSSVALIFGWFSGLSQFVFAESSEDESNALQFGCVAQWARLLCKPKLAL